MEFLIENWYIVVTAVCCVVFFIVCVNEFVGLSKDRKIENIKEWLKYAVVEAEKALGSGTGQLKLRMVYDMAIEKFPWVSRLISFETFSTWVDEALVWMREQLSKNEAVKNIVEK